MTAPGLGAGAVDGSSYGGLNPPTAPTVLLHHYPGRQPPCSSSSRIAAHPSRSSRMPRVKPVAQYGALAALEHHGDAGYSPSVNA